jgi:type I restriction enzyme S subunit
MVEWRKLGEITKRNKGIPITAGQMSELNTPSGDVRVFAAGQTIADIDEENLPKNCVHKLPSIIVKSRGYIDFEFYEKPFTHKNEMWSYSFNDKLEGKYIYYFLTTQTKSFRKKAKANSVKLPQLCVADTDNYLIPVPSLSVQKRIVDVLDTFTSSIENLKEQIALRRKQYEYYRDQLLDLEGKEGVEMKTLGSFGDVTKLAGFEFTEHVTYKEDGKIIALRGLNVKNGHLDLSQVKYIDGSNFGKLERSKLVTNDMLFTYVGTIGNVALVNEDDKYYLAPNVSRIRFDQDVINPKFALYVFMSEKFYRTQINKFLNSSSMKNLSMENIRKFVLPIPSLSEQQRIVGILDVFEESIQNLEAQLAGREKQYEYYRNKLLTFE